VSDNKAVTMSPGLVSTSADEVERVLQALLMRREPLAALVDGRAVSQWKLRVVDPARQYILVEPAAPGGAAALLARQRVTFLAEFGGMHIEFTAEGPRQDAGTTALRLGFPAVTVSHQRRAHPRAQVPADFPLRCAIPLGNLAVLDAQIMDLSEGGIGLQLPATNVSPGPGTVIKGCRVERPGATPVLVDLEVRHCRPIAFADGRRGERWGCRFVEPSNEAKDLIALFARE
jgi:c-di-GMP-binding flagellar brake protein YcgR